MLRLDEPDQPFRDGFRLFTHCDTCGHVFDGGSGRSLLSGMKFVRQFFRSPSIYREGRPYLTIPEMLRLPAVRQIPAERGCGDPVYIGATYHGVVDYDYRIARWFGSKLRAPSLVDHPNTMRS